VQTCIVHLVRHSLNFCSWKDRKAVAARLREVYGAETAEAARDALEAFDAEWGRQYPSIAQVSTSTETGPLIGVEKGPL
jgi:putative transposase